MAEDMAPPLEVLDLDRLRVLLAPAIADAAAFDGWSVEAVKAAALVHGVDADVAVYAFKGGEFGGGGMAMIAAWIEAIDESMAARAPADALASMKVRDRIAWLIELRLDGVAGREEALRRALAIMAMPQNAKGALELGWRTADRMWRLAGDVATDYNHYTKRAILAGVYAATLAILAFDDSEGRTETRAFLKRRLDGVMRFEKAKAQWLRPREDGFSIARFLGRLRYPAH